MRAELEDPDWGVVGAKYKKITAYTVKDLIHRPSKKYVGATKLYEILVQMGFSQGEMPPTRIDNYSMTDIAFLYNSIEIIMKMLKAEIKPE